MSSESLSETSDIYKEGDIVWVKLGSTWWPGVVNDSGKLPPEVEFKKPPLAVVKFFDEDTYEYVKSWSNICFYNCDKKVEYIKKGMAAFRKNVPHMQKFPKDVSNAEVLIGGNPNILSEPIFLEKKRYYSDDESPTRKGKNPKIQKEKKIRPKNVKKKSHITHRRFLGYNDYKAYICIQSPEKDRIPGDKEDEEVILLNTEPEQLYRCYCCCFTSKRLEVMIIHMKFHDSDTTTIDFKKKRSFTSKVKKERIKKPKSSLNKDIYQKSKEKQNSSPKKRDANLLNEVDTLADETKNEEKPKSSSDIRSNLLAEWEDSDDEIDDTFNSQLSSVTETDNILDENCDKESDCAFHLGNESTEEHKEDSSLNLTDVKDLSNLSDCSVEESHNNLKMDIDTQQAIKSCFDFDEEDEEEEPVIIPTTMTGRKIPRVIPITERRRSTDDLVSESYDSTITEKKNSIEENTNSNEIENDNERNQYLSKENQNLNKEKEKLNEETDNLNKGNEKGLNTEIESLNIENQSLNKENEYLNQENESCSTENENSSKENKDLNAGNENENSITGKEYLDKGELDNAFNELMETTSVPELPDLNSTLKCEQNFHGSKTIKFPDKQKGNELHSRNIDILEKCESTEVATKLTNPKKRFVKSFEDFEFKQNVIKKRDELNQGKKTESEVVQKDSLEIRSEEKNNSSTDFLKLKTRIMSKIIQQANINEESKNKIMAKIENSVQTSSRDNITLFPHKSKEMETKLDEEDKIESLDVRNESGIDKVVTLYKSAPRNKILETFFNENVKGCSEQKQPLIENKLEQNSSPLVSEVSFSHELVMIEEPVTGEIQDNVPPKKKIHGRTSHPKKDRTLFENFVNSQKMQINEVKAEAGQIEVCDVKFDLHTQNKPDEFSEMDILEFVDNENCIIHSNKSDISPSNNLENLIISPKDSNSEHIDKLPSEKKGNPVPITLKPNDHLSVQNVSDVHMEKSAMFELKDDGIFPSKEEIIDEKNGGCEKICSPINSGNRIDISLVNEEPIEKKSDPMSYFSFESHSNSEKNPKLEKNIKKSSTRENEDIFNSEKELHEQILKTQIMESSCSIGALLESGKEEYDALEKASICLPDDAICSPPRKRKQSENCSDVEMLIEQNSDITYPLTKKMKKHQTSHNFCEDNSLDSYSGDLTVNTKTLEEVTETVNELVTKVSEFKTDSLVGVDCNRVLAEDIDNMICERQKQKMSSSITTEDESEQKTDMKETKIFAGDLDWEKSPNKTGIKKTDEGNEIDTTIKEDILQLDSTEEISEYKPDENHDNEKATNSDCPREEIVTEEIIYFNEQDTTIENIVENNECILKNIDKKDTYDSTQSVDNKLEGLVDDSNLEHTKEEIHNHTKSNNDDEQSKMTGQIENELLKPVSKQISPEEYVSKNSDQSLPVEINDSANLLEDKCSLKTNLSNVDSTDLIEKYNSASNEMKKIDCQNNENTFKEQKYSQELVAIEGNLTVVSEMDLAEGQVEITPDQVISSKKLTNPSNIYKDDSSSIASLSDNSREFDSVGTEFTSKAIMKEVSCAIGNKKSSTYGRTELLDILEGNLDTDKKIKDVFVHKKDVIEDFCDFEDHIPSQIVCATRLKHEKDEIIKDLKEKGKSKKNYKIASTASKLLERLTENKKDTNKIVKNEKPELINKHATLAMNAKVVRHKSGSSKPIILSEQIIKPASNPQINKSNKALDDIEDVEAFIIHKDLKKPKCENSGIEVSDQKPIVEKKSLKASKHPGKAKILQQTIITPSGEIIQPVATVTQTDETVFDINSMPIVLSDQILTPENIEKIPIVLSSEPSTTSTTVINQTAKIAIAGKKAIDNKVLTKIPNSATTSSVTQTISKPINIISKSSRTPRILQTSANRIIQRGSPLLPNTSKLGKYILVPQNSSLPPTKAVVKKMVLKRSPTPQNKGLPNNTSEVGGNKIMILTNQQGQQQRLLLTPAQQKLLGCQTQSSKISKTLFKGNIAQSNVTLSKKIISTSSPETNSSLGIKQAGPVGQTVLLTNSSIVATPSRIKAERLQSTSQSGPQSTSKVLQTVLMKNQQPNKKLQGSDEDLEKQVAEKLEAIKASSGIKSQIKPTETIKTSRNVSKQSVWKKNDTKGNVSSNQLETYSTKSGEVVSRIFSASDSKHLGLKEHITLPKITESKVAVERPLNQLVIQDAVGNQTTITEGQILALPSETIDGQPQSYMLVTLDQSGNLTPLNNEALMSLDPNLGLGGDISNMVLQIEQGSLTNAGVQPNPPLAQSAIMKSNKEIILQSNSLESLEKRNVPKIPTLDSTEPPLLVKPKITSVLPTTHSVEQTLVPHVNNESGQQLIISGDPVATQKFLESLTEGTTDLANLLASAEGNGIIIQTDGQQILINTDSSNQMLLSINNDSTSIQENSESSGNPIFATQLNKSQDILAAALADTDVFQQDQPSSQAKFPPQLSPNNSLYQINVGNVLETSLTLSSPIMTPLEVPSTNNKKIPDEEADILTQVPKNVDLPITITDPNISQTVANQQVASFIASELQTNLELNLPISETAISSVSKNIHSPSYSYTLSTLDDSVDITQKTFSSSMPLLSDDSEQSVQIMTNDELDGLHHKKYRMSPEPKTGIPKGSLEVNKRDEVISRGTSFLTDDDEEEKGRFTLGREMCSSLSEPPPEMFDLAEVSSSFAKTTLPSSLQSTPDPSERAKDDEMTDLSTHAESSNDGSCEIPVQPKIIAKSQNLDLLNSD